MGELSITTLFLMGAVYDVVLALVFAHVHATQRTYPGFRDWMLGAVSKAAGLLLLLSQAKVPILFSKLLGSTLIVVALERFYVGLRRFQGEQSPRRLDVLVVSGLSMSVFTYFIFGTFDTSVRVVSISLCLFYISVRSVPLCLRGFSASLRAEGRLLAGGFIGLALGNAGRILATVFVVREADLLQRSLAEALAMLLMNASSTAVALGWLIVTAKRLRLDLEAANSKVKHLEGIIPICMYCKKIRDDADTWRRIEHYVTEHSDARFSHGICPDCEDRAE